MPESGKSILLDDGRRGLLSSGKSAVYNSSGECEDCCGGGGDECDPCEPFVLARQTTHRDTNRCWDLTPYQGPDMAPTCSFWRIIETEDCYPHDHPWYGAGLVDMDGRLVGLPNQFCSTYGYNGYVELQIGCLSGSSVIWPNIDQGARGNCQLVTPVSEFYD